MRMASAVLCCLLALGAVTAAQTCPPGCRCYVTSIYCQHGHLTSLHSSMFTLPLASDIQHIRLDDNFISTIDPNTFSNFTSLHQLVLQMNEITQLPEGLFDSLKNLTNLYLNNNHLSFLPDGLFRNLGNLAVLLLNENRLTQLAPNTFSSLRNLETLCLHYNRLTSLTKSTFNGLDNLLVLSLGNNHLVELEKDVFEHLKSLNSLSLEQNQISRLHGRVFATLPQLQNLWLYNNNLTTVEDTAFAGSKTLNTLSLYNNMIAEVSKKAFFGLYSLQNLYLSNNRLHKLDPEVFASLTELEVLELQDNHLQNIEARLLSTMIHLQELNIVGNPINCSCSLKHSLMVWHLRRIQVDASCILSNGTMITDLSQLFCSEDYEKGNDSLADIYEGTPTVRHSQSSFGEEHTVAVDFSEGSPAGDMTTDANTLDYEKGNHFLPGVSERSRMVHQSQPSFAEEGIMATDFPTTASYGDTITGLNQLEDYKNRSDSSANISEVKSTVHLSESSSGEERTMSTNFPTRSSGEEMITDLSQLEDYKERKNFTANISEGKRTVQIFFGKNQTVVPDLLRSTPEVDMITDLRQLEDHEKRINSSPDISGNQGTVHPSQTSFDKETIGFPTSTPYGDMITDVSQLKHNDVKNNSATISDGKRMDHPGQILFDKKQAVSADSTMSSPGADMITDASQLNNEYRNDSSVNVSEGKRMVKPRQPSFGGERTIAADFTSTTEREDTIIHLIQVPNPSSSPSQKKGGLAVIVFCFSCLYLPALIRVY